ncbi:MAG: LOG family protein [Phycisphaerae bacterium]
MKDKIVTIFGSSKPLENEPGYKMAYEIGFALAAKGWTICNGGYGGTMEASAKGAKDAGGSTIGVTCTIFDKSGPNPFIDQVIETSDLFVRLGKLIELGQAYVVLPGGSGTLVELTLVWELIAKRLMEPKPIILIGRFWESVIETAAIERPKSKQYVQFADNAEDVIKNLSEK